MAAKQAETTVPIQQVIPLNQEQAKPSGSKAGKPAKKTKVPTTKRQLTFAVITNWRLGVAAAAEGMTVSQFVAKCVKEPLKHFDYPAMPARIKRLCVFDESEDVAA